MGAPSQRWAAVGQVRITLSLSPLVTATGRGCRRREAQTCLSLSREMHDETKAQGGAMFLVVTALVRMKTRGTQFCPPSVARMSTSASFSSQGLKTDILSSSSEVLGRDTLLGKEPGMFVGLPPLGRARGHAGLRHCGLSTRGMSAPASVLRWSL